MGESPPGFEPVSFGRKKKVAQAFYGISKKSDIPSPDVVNGVKLTESKDFNRIVRLLGRDLDGHLSLLDALGRIKGVGFNLAKSLVFIITKELKLPENYEIGRLNDEQIKKIEDIVKFPASYGLPGFILNRAFDRLTGTDVHLIENDLSFGVRQDIEAEKKIKSWVGWRHSTGKKVRGQHTRTSGRKGTTVGVVKKKLKPQKAKKPAPQSKK